MPLPLRGARHIPNFAHFQYESEHQDMLKRSEYGVYVVYPSSFVGEMTVRLEVATGDSRHCGLRLWSSRKPKLRRNQHPVSSVHKIKAPQYCTASLGTFPRGSHVPVETGCALLHLARLNNAGRLNWLPAVAGPDGCQLHVLLAGSSVRHLQSDSDHGG